MLDPPAMSSTCRSSTPTPRAYSFATFLSLRSVRLREPLLFRSCIPLLLHRIYELGRLKRDRPHVVGNFWLMMRQ